MECELDAKSRTMLSRLAYRAWAEAYDNLKAVRAEQPDGSPDWHQFHQSRIENAQKDFDKATHVKNVICKYDPLICGS